jgi:putative CocE/NonD family hydrolase
MREQPWFDGRFATEGASYVGFTKWALLLDPPPELATAVVAIAPHDLHADLYPGGAFLLSTFLEGWSFKVVNQEEGSLRRTIEMATSRSRVKRALTDFPLADAGERLLRGRGLWYREWVTHRDPDDPLWARSRMTEALERVQAPIVLQGGWQDGFLRQTMQQYARLSERGVDVALTSGPWTHMQSGTKGLRILMAEAVEWLDEIWLGSGRASRALPVKVFVRGPGGDGATLPRGHRRRSNESSTPRTAHALPTRRPTRKRRQVHL